MPSHERLGGPLTYRDLQHTPDDGNRYEVVDGVLLMTPFPGYAHQRVIGRLTTVLTNHVLAHDLGEVLPAGLMVVLDPPTGVGPDVVFIAKARMGAMRRDGYYDAPELIVEVLSSRPERDRVIKARKYADAGVAHYWIVDPVRHVLWAYRLERCVYVADAELGADAVFEPSLFPGLSIPLRGLWT